MWDSPLKKNQFQNEKELRFYFLEFPLGSTLRGRLLEEVLLKDDSIDFPWAFSLKEDWVREAAERKN